MGRRMLCWVHTHQKADWAFGDVSVTSVRMLVVHALVEGHELAFHDGCLDDVMRVVLWAGVDTLGP